MNTQKRNRKAKTEENPLAAIFFVFGALHAYNSVKADKRSTFEIISKGIKIVSPVLVVQLFVSICIGTTFIEAIEILETTLH